MNDFFPYVAGFFDGEGSIGIYPKKSSYKGRAYVTYYLRTQLVQKRSTESDLLLDMLIDKFGGGGSLIPCGEAKKAAWNWQLSSDKACDFLEKIYPCLLIKKEQARIAMDWQRKRGPVIKDSKGRNTRKTTTDIEEDKAVSMILKSLKKG